MYITRVVSIKLELYAYTVYICHNILPYGKRTELKKLKTYCLRVRFRINCPSTFLKISKLPG